MNKTIVWVEDDIGILHVMIEPLIEAGYTFLKFETVAEALGSMDQIKEADLLLLDMLVRPGSIDKKFGRYPGLDLLRTIRKSHIDIPTIVFSVVNQSKNNEALRELGVVEILPKGGSTDPFVLMEHVERVLNIVNTN